jgi:ketosteroid isomerase-like protein
MKSTKLLLVAVVAAVSAIPAIGQAKSPDETKIEALVAAEAAAINAKDVSAIMKAYVADESLIVSDIIPPRQYVGAKAFRADWQGFVDLFDGPVQFEVTDLHVEAEGTLGYSRSIQHVVGKDTKGQAIDITWRDTAAYRKIDGKWLIVHEHGSVPVDLATGKPDVTSKP